MKKKIILSKQFKLGTRSNEQEVTATQPTTQISLKNSRTLRVVFWICRSFRGVFGSKEA